MKRGEAEVVEGKYRQNVVFWPSGLGDFTSFATILAGGVYGDA
jgi:hypothetical protein